MRLIDANALAESDMAKLIDRYLYNQCNLTVGLAAALMPEIEAEPVRHGRWIYRSDDAASCYCSECNEEALTAPYERNCIESDFCPCCGAKMDAADTNVLTSDGGDAG